MGISRQQALECFRSEDLIGIGIEADAIRRRLHPEGVVSYRCVQQIDVATGKRFSAGDAGAKFISLRLNCGTSRLLEQVTESYAATRKEYPSCWIEVGLQCDAALDARAAASTRRWIDAGANSIFVDPRRENGNFAAVCTAALKIHRSAHTLGIKTTLAIPFGCGEQLSERLDLLEAVRRLQDETGGFAGFVPLGLDAPGGRELDGVTAVERLKMLAVARMFLHNIDHMQSPQIGSGLKVLQTGLRFGADDVEIRVPQQSATEQDLRRVIRDAGFRPVERDGSYSTMFLN